MEWKKMHTHTHHKEKENVGKGTSHIDMGHNEIRYDEFFSRPILLRNENQCEFPFRKSIKAYHIACPTNMSIQYILELNAPHSFTDILTQCYWSDGNIYLCLQCECIRIGEKG